MPSVPAKSVRLAIYCRTCSALAPGPKALSAATTMSPASHEVASMLSALSPLALSAAQHDMYAALKASGLKADNMEATSWDAGLIVVAALRALGPGASAEQVRQYIAN